MTDDFTIRRATAHDAETLSVFGRRVFDDTFGPDNDPADMQLYLDSAFSTEKQLAELCDPHRTWLLVERGGALIAFACVRDQVTHPHVQAARPVELQRFYVDKAWHGRGVAAMLMQAALTQARDLHGDAVWLGVWSQNTRAIAFYRKWGFERVGGQTFTLGTDEQLDDVMRLAL